MIRPVVLMTSSVAVLHTKGLPGMYRIIRQKSIAKQHLCLDQVRAEEQSQEKCAHLSGTRHPTSSYEKPNLRSFKLTYRWCPITR
jgi:hypothetical protein